MKIPSLILLAVCLAACAPAVSTGANASSQAASSDISSVDTSLAPTATLLPDGFIGRWDASLDACKATSDMKLTVTQTGLTFWESAGQITGVTINAPGDVTVKAAFSGEGEQWNSDLRLVLADNGNRLKVDDTVRVRCP